MGNNQSKTPPPHVIHNEEMRNLLTTEEYENVSSYRKQIANEIIDWANKDGLEVKEISSNPNETDSPNGVVLIDSESGKEIGISNKALRELKNNEVLNDDKYIPRLHTLLEDIRDLPTSYEGVQMTDKINIRTRYTGAWFNPTTPDAIYMAATTLELDPKKAYKTGWKAIMIHEMTHLYDYNTYGGTGKDGVFSEYREYQPSTYGDYKRSEVISTTVEMVYSGKLRTDAQLPDGSVPTNYEQWYEAWSPLAKEAEILLYGQTQ